MLAPFFINVFLYSFLRSIKLRGLMTFVKTAEGPIKTSSSTTTPSYKETLFCIFTLLPICTLFAIKTFCPRLQCSPTTACITWLKCHILLLFPIEPRRSALLSDLWQYQLSVRHISDAAIRHLADAHQLSAIEVEGVASFYHFFHRQPLADIEHGNAHRIRIGTRR